MLYLLFIAISLVSITVTMQAIVTTYWIHLLRRHYTSADGSLKPHSALRVITSTVMVLLLTHVIQCVLWALTYQWLIPVDSMQTFEEALYFSLITFTTLGYGDVTLLDEKWRLLSGIEALNGIILAGWTTAFLFLVVQRTWEGLHRDRDS